jgi:hypothetical protein
VFEALNAVAIAAACVIVGTEAGTGEAMRFFELALRDQIKSLLEFHNGDSNDAQH